MVDPWLELPISWNTKLRKNLWTLTTVGSARLWSHVVSLWSGPDLLLTYSDESSSGRGKPPEKGPLQKAGLLDESDKMKESDVRKLHGHSSIVGSQE